MPEDGSRGQHVSVNLNRLMIFKLNLNVILVVCKSSQSPLEMLVFFSAQTGKMSVSQSAWYLLLSCAAAVRSAEPHTTFDSPAVFSVLILSSLLSEGKFLMAHGIPVSL